MGEVSKWIKQWIKIIMWKWHDPLTWTEYQKSPCHIPTNPSTIRSKTKMADSWMVSFHHRPTLLPVTFFSVSSKLLDVSRWPNIIVGTNMFSPLCITTGMPLPLFQILSLFCSLQTMQHYCQSHFKLDANLSIHHFFTKKTNTSCPQCSETWTHTDYRQSSYFKCKCSICINVSFLCSTILTWRLTPAYKKLT